MTTLIDEAQVLSPSRKLGDAKAHLTRIIHPTASAAVITMIVSGSIAGIMLQQLVHTPWGLPGHRVLFWLTPLIAARWAIDRPGTALGIATASSAGILLFDPAMGLYVAPYLVAGFLVDLAASAPFIRRHPWVMIPLAPVMVMANLINPFMHNLATSSLPTAISGMWFFVQGHLLWGLAAGIVGISAGMYGQPKLRQLRSSNSTGS